MDICITESLCLNLELIQHCKSSIFQYEIKIKQEKNKEPFFIYVKRSLSM